MTREEEIIKVAELCASANTQIIGDWGEHFLGFIHGAEWADRTMIDKACEWLDCYIDNYLFIDAENKAGIKWDNFINDFRKAMKGEEDEDHIIDANKKVDRVIGTADHIKTALDVLNKKGGEE